MLYFQSYLLLETIPNHVMLDQSADQLGVAHYECFLQ